MPQHTPAHRQEIFDPELEAEMTPTARAGITALQNQLPYDVGQRTAELRKRHKQRTLAALLGGGAADPEEVEFRVLPQVRAAQKATIADLPYLFGTPPGVPLDPKSEEFKAMQQEQRQQLREEQAKAAQEVEWRTKSDFGELTSKDRQTIEDAITEADVQAIRAMSIVGEDGEPTPDEEEAERQKRHAARLVEILKENSRNMGRTRPLREQGPGSAFATGLEQLMGMSSEAILGRGALPPTRPDPFAAHPDVIAFKEAAGLPLTQQPAFLPPWEEGMAQEPARAPLAVPRDVAPQTGNYVLPPSTAQAGSEYYQAAVQQQQQEEAERAQFGGFTREEFNSFASGVQSQIFEGQQQQEERSALAPLVAQLLPGLDPTLLEHIPLNLLMVLLTQAGGQGQLGAFGPLRFGSMGR